MVGFFGFCGNGFANPYATNKKQNTHTMDLLIAILMYLGVFASPENLKNEEFLKTNEASINKATEMMHTGEYSSKCGIVTTSGNI